MDLIKLDQFPAVAANQQASLVTDKLLDRSVHALIFELGGTTFTKAHISNLKVSLDGKDILPVITGTNLQKINTDDGLPNDAAYLVYYLGDPTAQTIRGQHLGDLDLSVYRKPLEISCDIGAATAPTLQVYALTGVPKLEMGIGFDQVEAATIHGLKRTQLQPSGAVSEKSYGINFGSSVGGRLRKILFFHTNLTKVDVEKNSIRKRQNVGTALNNFINSIYGRVAQSGLYALNFVFDGNQGEAETTVDKDNRAWNIQVSLTTSAGDTIDVYADMHQPLAFY